MIYKEIYDLTGKSTSWFVPDKDNKDNKSEYFSFKLGEQNFNTLEMLDRLNNYCYDYSLDGGVVLWGNYSNEDNLDWHKTPEGRLIKLALFYFPHQKQEDVVINGKKYSVLVLTKPSNIQN